MSNLLNASLYMLAIINPVSKIFILSMFSKQAKPYELEKISIRSTVIAFLILTIFATTGNIILSKIFHVELYSFKIAAGIILFTMGFKSLFKGVFFEVDEKAKLTDLSIVPLASPMIAGPATITVVISYSVEYGLLLTFISTILALGVNLIIMLLSKYISDFLSKYHLMEALIRITGLIVATIAVQMVLMGFSTWYLGIR